MKKIILTIFYCFGLSFIINGKLYSDCDLPPACPPPGALGNANIPWLNGGCAEIDVKFENEKHCLMCVCYCWRDVGAVAPFIEIVITKATKIDTTCDSEPYSLPELWKYAGKSIIEQNSGNLNWYCPPCPEEVTNYAIYFGSCWDFSVPQQCPGTAYCRVTYAVCCSGSVRSVREIDRSAIGGTCQQGCIEYCP